MINYLFARKAVGEVRKVPERAQRSELELNLDQPKEISLLDFLASHGTGSYEIGTDEIPISKLVGQLPYVDQKKELPQNLLIIEPHSYQVLTGVTSKVEQGRVRFFAENRWKGYYSEEIFSCHRCWLPWTEMPLGRLGESTLFEVNVPLTYLDRDNGAKGGIAKRRIIPEAATSPLKETAGQEEEGNGIFSRLLEVFRSYNAARDS